MNYQCIMNKKIYLVIVLILAANFSFGQQISTGGRDSIKVIIYQFGQLVDLSSATAGAKQSSPRPPDRNTAAQFANLFRAYSLDTLRKERDSMVLINFLDPKLRLFDCYKIRSDNDSILKKEVDSCFNEKKLSEFYHKSSVNMFIDTVFKFYSQTVSDINENDIMLENEYIQRVGKKRYQIPVSALLNEFNGNIDPNYSNTLGFKSYLYKKEKDRLSLNLRFYVSYDVYKQRGKKAETNFKIDSVSLIPVYPTPPSMGITKGRGYIEPYVNYGMSFISLNSDDPRFDNLTENNNFVINTGVTGTFFFNDRRFSKWDLGFTTGAGYKTYHSSYSLSHYSDSLTISDDFTAEQLGGPYDLYVDASNLEQQNQIRVLEVPLQFSAYYNFNKKRNLGIYSRIGGVFNLVLSNDHTMKDGSVTYTGHQEKLVNGTYTDYYFNADLPYFGFSTYKAGASDENKLSLQKYFISGRLNVGIFGTNKNQSIGWHLGTFADIGFTDLLASGHEPATSLSKGQGNIDSFYGITDKLNINNWGVEFGIAIQLYKEKIIYRTSK